MSAPAASPVLTEVFRYIAALRDLRIEVVGASAKVALSPDRGFVGIGFVLIYDSGLIQAAAYIGATASQIGEIIRQAELARVNGPVGEQWRRIADQGWEATVLEPVYVAPPTRRALCALHL